MASTITITLHMDTSRMSQPKPITPRPPPIPPSHDSSQIPPNQGKPRNVLPAEAGSGSAYNYMVVHGVHPIATIEKRQLLVLNPVQ
ncbi:hypothetical protein R69749_03469 [Paraburkholderia domus]|uniref:Uncharacterized protein n=1 Tax=Paraburkholderia domus TaxID=2793075 RepID=A0A9N8R3W2_9BURK|nr:hypothetical protein R75483_00448 [Paraburkholderia domus]CAE6706818.1 hypothetical protein R70006_01015 [Paraburkholderia domus]CAE6819439.1 hypothetical protein R69749_03469 [Paraburkholderia domus]CAE6926258.1 hypothetical protein R70211_04798 [Paraburkholderia domus]